MKENNQVVYILWRDIPAQIVVGKGRKAKKIKLPERFEKAIDRCAMKLNLIDTDSYLSEWHKSNPVFMEGTIDEIIESESKKIDKKFDEKKLRNLIDNDGKE